MRTLRSIRIQRRISPLRSLVDPVLVNSFSATSSSPYPTSLYFAPWLLAVRDAGRYRNRNNAQFHMAPLMGTVSYHPTFDSYSRLTAVFPIRHAVT